MIVETGFHLKNAADLSSEVGPPLSMAMIIETILKMLLKQF